MGFFVRFTYSVTKLYKHDLGFAQILVTLCRNINMYNSI